MEKFKKLDKNARENACHEYFDDVTSFSSFAKDRTEYIKSDFKTLIEKTFAENLDQYIEKLSFDGVTQTTPAHLCVVEDEGKEYWAMTYGYHEGISLVFHKSRNSENYQIFGLLEIIPFIPVDFTSKQLSNMYIHGQLDCERKKLQPSGWLFHYNQWYMNE